MYHRDGHINYVNGQQIVGRMLAFGEFWRRLSQLDKFNTCHWHSACAKFGGLENLITLLSLSQALAYNSTISYFARGAPASIYGFSCIYAREAAVFLYPATKIYSIIF